MDKHRHASETVCGETGYPVKYLFLVAVVLIDHGVRLTPFPQRIRIDELHFIRVVEMTGELAEEF